MVTIKTEQLPIKIWARQEDLTGFEEAILQAKNLANLPVARKWVCLMPDFHIGYGMPIGGVLATSGAVVPNAVGVDIGCGMIAAQTDLNADDLSENLLQEIRKAIHKRVPVGMNHHESKQKSELLSSVKIDNQVVKKELERAYYQLGTLGSGNHFIEIQKDENGKVWVMLHSGSRNLGKKVCDYYHAKAIEYITEKDIQIPDMDLAYLVEGTREFDEYVEAMQFCMLYAQENREKMFEAVVEAFGEQGIVLPVVQKFDTHHNFASLEEYFGEKLWIHRKGAVKAEGLVTIPGSMGTSSYIGDGLMNEESFSTCSHGAGRVLGRKQAKAMITHEQAVEMMKGVVYGIKHGDYDEMPLAYKDIDQVMENEKDLVKPVHKLKPLAVVKG